MTGKNLSTQVRVRRKIFILIAGSLIWSSCMAKEPMQNSTPSVADSHTSSVADSCPQTVPGYEVVENNVLTVEIIKDAARNGVAVYQAAFGEMLLYGKAINRDPVAASYWLNCAAQAGNADAALNLALQIYNADNIEQDFTRAAKLARQSAVAGSAQGQQLLGNMYHNGEGVPKDTAAAIKWHSMAATQGSVPVQAGLGYRFLVGDGVPVDLDLASKWLRLAADAGNKQARRNLEIALSRQQEAGGNSIDDHDGPVVDQADQESGQPTIMVLPHWQVGEIVKYSFDKIHQQPGKEPKTSHFDAQVKVLLAEKDNYVIEIIMPNTQLPKQVQNSPEIKEMLNTRMLKEKGLRLELLIDEFGTVQKLNNWEQVRDSILQFMERLAAASHTPFPEKTRTALLQLYSEEASTRQLLLRDLDFFLRPLGFELTPGEPLVIESLAESALTGPLEVTDTYLLKDEEQGKDELHIVHERDYDYQSVAETANLFLQKINQDSKPRVKEINQLKVHESAIYELDSSTGWLSFGQQNRKATAAEGQIIEDITLRVSRY